MEGSTACTVRLLLETRNVTLSICPNLWLIEVHQDLRQQFKVQLTERSSRLMRVLQETIVLVSDDARAAILRTVRTDWL